MVVRSRAIALFPLPPFLHTDKILSTHERKPSNEATVAKENDMQFTLNAHVE